MIINKLFYLPLNIYVILDDLDKSVDRPHELTYQKVIYFYIRQNIQICLNTYHSYYRQEVKLLVNRN